MGEPVRNLQERDAFILHFNREATQPIVGRGTNDEPPFSSLNPWMQYQQEPDEYDVRVDLNGFITEGGVDVFLVPDGQFPGDGDDEPLWQLSPATPFPHELRVEPIHNTRVAKIQPVLTTHYEQFRKMLGCLRWVKVGNRRRRRRAVRR